MRLGETLSFIVTLPNEQCDVGPVLRRFLTRAPDFFDGL